MAKARPAGAAADLAQGVVERGGPADHAIIEVRPEEIADEDDRVAQAELLDDVGADARGGGGGERVHGGVGEEFLESAELAVVRAETVAPMADAVGFVDGEGADPRTAKTGEERFVGESFGRDENELVFAPFDPGMDAPAVGRIEAAVEEGGGDGAGEERVHLVLHERNQRGDDDGGVFGQEGRSLVAQ